EDQATQVATEIAEQRDAESSIEGCELVRVLGAQHAPGDAVQGRPELSLNGHRRETRPDEDERPTAHDSGGGGSRVTGCGLQGWFRPFRIRSLAQSAPSL